MYIKIHQVCSTEGAVSVSLSECESDRVLMHERDISVRHSCTVGLSLRPHLHNG